MIRSTNLNNSGNGRAVARYFRRRAGRLAAKAGAVVELTDAIKRRPVLYWLGTCHHELPDALRFLAEKGSTWWLAVGASRRYG